MRGKFFMVSFILSQPAVSLATAPNGRSLIGMISRPELRVNADMAEVIQSTSPSVRAPWLATGQVLL